MLGHSHAQKARPTRKMSRAMMTRLTTARGTMVLVAIIVPRAPRGHRAEMDSQPNPDMVPVETPRMRPAAMTTNTTAAMVVRRFWVRSFSERSPVVFFASAAMDTS